MSELGEMSGCASSYAVVAAEALEAAYARTNDVLVSFSE